MSEEQRPDFKPEQYPTDEELIDIYAEIEKTAREAVINGQVVGNPIVSARDKRYGISPDALVLGSPVYSFLSDVVLRISQVEPTAAIIPPKDLHMTLGELFFSPSGKRGEIRVTGELVRKYYASITKNLPDYSPIDLKFWKIIPALDPQRENEEGRSLTVVAAFTTDNDQSIHKLRGDVKKSVGEESLPVSTSPTSYVESRGHVTVYPPIPLEKEKRRSETPTFLTPSQFDRIRGLK